ncbi:aldehyde dehydrogenase family protein [Nocardioides sp. LMS-CY]|uniref:aldehyde dehydrogenase family protein n=1 Tax=Nocardioides sp. (strain LMS-CY) TaxID=2840457 RepID=UPI001C008022|nr:aldehyde dehydrogenase family protein [Nocardioides sp. LMS-CY]QWF22300.1 aldehyde dehydrogenase family protein [Nocardioides sp. LMS-CY]
MEQSTIANWVSGRSEIPNGVATRPVLSPHDGTVVGRLPIGDSSVVDAAVESAVESQVSWGRLHLSDRIRHVQDFASSVESRTDELAALQRLEMGQPLALGRMLIVQGIEALRSACALAETYGFTAHDEDATGSSRLERRPLGVAALITPWNSPVLSVLEQCGPLLLSGNALVLKPSELCPMSIALLASISTLPPGVMNVVNGDGTTGEILCAHREVQLVTFTGSVRSGRSVALAAARKLTRATLELGGKDAVVVDRDVDVASVAAEVAFGSLLNTGQICTSMERIYVHSDIAADFTDAVVAATEAWRADEGGTEMPALGPLASVRQRELVVDQLQDAATRGARVVRGGTVPDGPGNNLPATVVTGVDGSMRLMQEETFGPVVAIETVASFEEGLRKAAESEYGLGATVYSNTEAHLQSAAQLPVALLWLNQWQGRGEIMVYEPTRSSGMGATGGTASFDAATRPQTVYRRSKEL